MAAAARAKKPDLDMASFKLGIIEVLDGLDTLRRDGTPPGVVARCIETIHAGASQ